LKHNLTHTKDKLDSRLVDVVCLLLSTRARARPLLVARVHQTHLLLRTRHELNDTRRTASRSTFIRTDHENLDTNNVDMTNNNEHDERVDSPAWLKPRDSTTSFVRYNGAFDFNVRFDVRTELNFETTPTSRTVVSLLIAVGELLLSIELVDVLTTASNSVSWTRRANGNSPRLQNRPV
jgi:hypothetical protein